MINLIFLYKPKTWVGRHKGCHKGWPPYEVDRTAAAIEVEGLSLTTFTLWNEGLSLSGEWLSFETLDLLRITIY